MRKPEETEWETLGIGKDNIKMNLKERVWAVVELIHLTPNRYMLRPLVNTVMSLTVAQNAQNILIRREHIGFLRVLLHGVSRLST